MVTFAFVRTSTEPSGVRVNCTVGMLNRGEFIATFQWNTRLFWLLHHPSYSFNAACANLAIVSHEARSSANTSSYLRSALLTTSWSDFVPVPGQRARAHIP
jgi:hypothetical protein